MPNISVVLGAQWGDEGKGKLVDILGETHKIIVRSGGGANAGHTIVRDKKKYIFHLLPSGLLSEGNIGVIGNGCVVHLPNLCTEITTLEKQGLLVRNRVLISDRAHLLFEYHREIDALQEKRKGANSIGTTKRGIGPCYSDKISRRGIRAGDALYPEILRKKLSSLAPQILEEYGIAIDIEKEISNIEMSLEMVKGNIIDTSVYLENEEIQNNNILIEGAQAFALDIDFGTYPFVTSSSITTAGMGNGCGISPRKFTEVIGVLKAYCTRVGEGPFPSELVGEEEEYLRKKGGEFGATTGRPRRCGWLDLLMIKDFVRINQPDCWNITKLDILDSFEKIGVVTGYTINGQTVTTLPAQVEQVEKIEPIIEYLEGWKEDISQCKTRSSLPRNAQKYLDFIEGFTGVNIKYIGVGADNSSLIRN